MREFDLTKRKHFAELGKNKVWKIYDNIQEAVADGIKEGDILRDWRAIKDNPELIAKIRSEEGLWILTDDKFVPDRWDVIEEVVVPMYDANGNIIPTDGCVCPVIEYVERPPDKPFYPVYFRTPVGTHTFKGKRGVTTEKRKNPYAFSWKQQYLGHAYKVSPKKKKAALALLNPLSPAYGNLTLAYLEGYPERKYRHKAPVIRTIALRFFNRPWFYRLIKTDWLLSMLVNDLKSELEKLHVNDKFVAEKLKKAVDISEEKQDVKSLLLALSEIRSILEKSSNSRTPYPGELPPKTPQGLLPTPFVDSGDQSHDRIKLENDEAVKRAKLEQERLGEALHIREAVVDSDDISEFVETQIMEGLENETQQGNKHGHAQTDA